MTMESRRDVLGRGAHACLGAFAVAAGAADDPGRDSWFFKRHASSIRP